MRIRELRIVIKDINLEIARRNMMKQEEEDEITRKYQLAVILGLEKAKQILYKDISIEELECLEANEDMYLITLP